MRQTPPKSRWIFWLKKALIFLAIFLGGLILLLSVTLVLLPRAVSTDRVRIFAESRLSDILARDVRIGAMDWTWKTGLVIQNFKISDIDEFSENPIILIKKCKVKPDIKQLFSKTAALFLEISGAHVRIIRNPDGTLNIAALGKKSASAPHPVPEAPQTEKTPDAPQKDAPTKPFALPLDISSRILFSDLHLSYADRIKNESYAVSDLFLVVDVPSLFHQAATLALKFEATVNGRAIPQASLDISLENLFTPDGTLSIDRLKGSLDASLPGIMARVRSDMANPNMANPTMTGDIRLDLERLASVFLPLAPALPSPTAAGGLLSLNINANRPDQNSAGFDIMLSGSNLFLSGAVLDQQSIGPGNLNIHLSGALDLKKDHLIIASADLHLLEHSRLQASGEIRGLRQPNRDIRFSVSPLALNVDELAAFARPFIPDTLAIPPHPGEPARITLHSLEFEGEAPKGQTAIRLEDLAVYLPEFSVNHPQTGLPDLRLSDARIGLEGFSANFIDFFPKSLSAGLSLDIKEIFKADGAGNITVSEIHLDHLKAAADNLLKTKDSPLGIQGDVRLENQLAIAEIALPALIRVRAAKQNLKMRAGFSHSGEITLRLDELDLHSPGLSVLKEGFRPLHTGLDLHFSLDKLHVPVSDPLHLDLDRFLARINLEEALSLVFQAGATDGGNTKFQGDLDISADIQALLAKLPRALHPGMDGAGRLAFHAHAAGRKPSISETEHLRSMDFTDHLSFMEKIGLEASLTAASLAIPQKTSPGIFIGHINAEPLLSYAFEGASGLGRVRSRVSAGKFEGLPGISPDAPISADFSMEGAHEFARTVSLHPTFSISPSAAQSKIDVTLSGLDHILSRSPMPNFLLWPADLDAHVMIQAAVPDLSRLKALGLPGLTSLEVSGKWETFFNLDLKAGEFLTAALNLQVPNLDLTKTDVFAAQSVYADLTVSKTYQIRSVPGSRTRPPLSGLSAQVLNAAALGPGGENADVSGHLRKIHARTKRAPSLSLESFDLKGAPFPLAVGESMIFLDFQNTLPRLDYFQVNLLGGTVNGALALTADTPETETQSNAIQNFHLDADLNFSGINFAQIFPRAFGGDAAQADISGQLSAQFPLTPALPDLLENGEIRVEFTEIGARALERLLYALDPHETNEAMVAQRGLLKLGSPRKVRLEVKDGFLSLTGEVAVQGVGIPLPAIRRLNLARIPGMDRFQGSLSGMAPVVEFLKILSAKEMVLNHQEGTVFFK